MRSVGLVLEGGGSRGIYTVGVLDAFVEQKITFPYCIGVSAGACTGSSYVAGQKKRYFRILTGYRKDPRYLSVRNFFRTGYPMDNDFVFGELSYELEALDIHGFHRFIADGGTFIAVATDCQSGKPAYFSVRNLPQDGIYMNASSSLPLISPMVEINGNKYLDGGISDSIPLAKAMEDGQSRCVVVLTRNSTYRKSPSKILPFFSMRYRRYPKLLEAMKNRYLVYNECLDRIEALERLGKLLVIRPDKPVKIGRMEKDEKKMEALYQIGYADGLCYVERVRAFQMQE